MSDLNWEEEEHPDTEEEEIERKFWKRRVECWGCLGF